MHVEKSKNFKENIQNKYKTKQQNRGLSGRLVLTYGIILLSEIKISHLFFLIYFTKKNKKKTSKQMKSGNKTTDKRINRRYLILFIFFFQFVIAMNRVIDVPLHAWNSHIDPCIIL